MRSCEENSCSSKGVSSFLRKWSGSPEWLGTRLPRRNKETERPQNTSEGVSQGRWKCVPEPRALQKGGV